MTASSPESRADAENRDKRNRDRRSSPDSCAKPRYVFVTGGVVSSLGKGIAMASLGALLQARGFKVKLRKLDPYLNVDPGTMSPYQHGEVYVTDDGAETDLDLGHYERFVGRRTGRDDSITAGRIYRDLIACERRGDFKGATVQVIPHVTDAIKAAILKDNEDHDIVLCEIGGTVGDIEGLPFFEAIRQLGCELGERRRVFIHVTLAPYIAGADEVKTKPTQHSVKELRSVGIRADLLLCRAPRPLCADERRKIALFGDAAVDDVIVGCDVESIYQAPLAYHEEGLDRRTLVKLGLDDAERPDLASWRRFDRLRKEADRRVAIAVVGKYTGLRDAYKSLIEALNHAGVANAARIRLKWIDSTHADDVAAQLEDVNGVLIPGGFGERGFEGKIAACRCARENDIPFFGICLGMQAAVVEYARNAAELPDAGSTEFHKNCLPLVGLMTEWVKDDDIAVRSHNDPRGETLRLGAYPAVLQPDSRVAQAYNATRISERHRHRYEVNNRYRSRLEKYGMKYSGLSPDGSLPETIEIPDHPWYVGVQFHPELTSRPLQPHPLFFAFVAAALKQETHPGTHPGTPPGTPQETPLR